MAKSKNHYDSCYKTDTKISGCVVWLAIWLWLQLPCSSSAWAAISKSSWSLLGWRYSRRAWYHYRCLLPLSVVFKPEALLTPCGYAVILLRISASVLFELPTKIIGKQFISVLPYFILYGSAISLLLIRHTQNSLFAVNLVIELLSEQIKNIF